MVVRGGNSFNSGLIVTIYIYQEGLGWELGIYDCFHPLSPLFPPWFHSRQVPRANHSAAVRMVVFR